MRSPFSPSIVARMPICQSAVCELHSWISTVEFGRFRDCFLFLYLATARLRGCSELRSCTVTLPRWNLAPFS